MVFQTEKQLKEYDEKLEESSKEELKTLVEKLKKAIEDKDLTGIDTIMEEMNSKWQEVSTQLYQEAEENTTNPESNNEDATDVEFEEVK